MLLFSQFILISGQIYSSIHKENILPNSLQQTELSLPKNVLLINTNAPKIQGDPCRIGQTVERSKSKSTQPRFDRRWVTLYTKNVKIRNYRVPSFIEIFGLNFREFPRLVGRKPATAASYCPSWAGELLKQNMTKSHERWDGKLCI